MPSTTNVVAVGMLVPSKSGLAKSGQTPYNYRVECCRNSLGPKSGVFVVV